MDPLFHTSKAVLNQSSYDAHKSILTTFHFKPGCHELTQARLREASKLHLLIEGKDLYVFDGFFSEAEEREMREISENLDLEVPVFGPTETLGKLENKVRWMDNPGRWKLFSNPPGPFQELYRFFGFLAEKLQVDVSTQPWMLCSESSSLPAFVVNYHEAMSVEDERGYKHCDCEPEKGVCFAIPNLHANERGFHKTNFVNGDVGKPLLLTVILYSTSEKYLPEYGLGTAYYDQSGKKVFSSDCIDMRLVLFEGNIMHGVEASHLPEKGAWRISYVFKLLLNPKDGSQNIKESLKKLLLSDTIEG
ncbi:hypothetical protein [Simkania sp.]|uniref:hypothetical protein n=1 Tax=Simkania sp. TaxID=34094 RepID=UPI003B52C4AD